MRKFIYTIVAMMAIGTTFPAQAFDDGFGDRFYNQSPAAFGEHTDEGHEVQDIAMDDIAIELQNIKPAAGDEEEAVEAEREAE